MISINLTAVKEKQTDSARIAAAMAAYECRGGRVFEAPGAPEIPPPAPRSEWRDPAAVLKRRRKIPTTAERNVFREHAEAL